MLGKMAKFKNIEGRNFVAIMLTIALFALFLRYIIQETLKWNIAQNESNASSTLKLILTALENYAKDHSGVYPTDISILTKTNPAYLDKDYFLPSAIKGYNYFCSRLDPSGYNCSAVPRNCKVTGETIYTISTNGLLVTEKCSKKE
jgi:type II secretory pathway pseudopilin PulG